MVRSQRQELKVADHITRASREQEEMSKCYPPEPLFHSAKGASP